MFGRWIINFDLLLFWPWLVHELRSFLRTCLVIVQSWGWIRPTVPGGVDVRVPTLLGLPGCFCAWKKSLQLTRLIPLEIFVHETQCFTLLSASSIGEKARLLLACIGFAFHATWIPGELCCGLDYPKTFFFVCECHSLLFSQCNRLSVKTAHMQWNVGTAPI